MKEIKIIISKSGEITIDVSGVKGSICKELTKSLEDKLGKTTKDKKKTDYYEQEQDTGDQQSIGY